MVITFFSICFPDFFRVRQKIGLCLFAWFLFLNFHVAFAQTHSQTASPFSRRLVERQKDRVNFSHIKSLIDAIHLQPGMTIVDIGTGTGQFAYAFSQHMQGKGIIFATDIEQKKINYVKKMIKKHHLKNIIPVFVQPQGVDPFYTLHKFDIIFIAHTTPYIENRVDYYRTLKQQLNDKGIFVILNYKKSLYFSSKGITDLQGCLNVVSTLAPSSPFYKYLFLLRNHLLQQPNARHSLETQQMLAKAFNEMINDVSFYSYFLDAQGMPKIALDLLPDEEQYLKWTYRWLKDEDRVLDAVGLPQLYSPQFSLKHEFFIKTINKMLIFQKFRPFLYNGKAPYLSGGTLEGMNKDKNDMAQAGLRVKSAHDFIPFEILLIFEKIPEKNKRLQ